MSDIDPKFLEKGIQAKIYDFSGGLWTVDPPDQIPDGASPYCKNVIFDKKGRLQKIFGTTLLLTEAYNSFATNPIWNLFTWKRDNGEEYLIIQGVSTGGTMCIWSLEPGATSVTSLASSGLNLYCKFSFASYLDCLYAWNGEQSLRYYNGKDWVYPHDIITVGTKEEFSLLCSHNRRLWAACSTQHPTRLIYTERGHNSFYDYYKNNSTTHFFDFPGELGQITGLRVFQGSLMVMQESGYTRIFGDIFGEGEQATAESITFQQITRDKGCINPGSLLDYKSNVWYISDDGYYVYGDTGVIADLEDQKLKTHPNIARVTSEIDDYWSTNMSYTVPSDWRVKTWSSTDFPDWTTKNNVSVNTSSITTQTRPKVFNFSLYGDHTAGPLNDYDGSNVGWTQLETSKNGYYGQAFSVGPTVGAGYTFKIPSKVSLFLKYTGTMSTGIVLNVYVTTTHQLPSGYYEMDSAKEYFAEGVILGTAVTSSTGSWVDCTFDYWDYPQGLQAGNTNETRYWMLVVQSSGDTSSNYVSWAYSTDSAYTGGNQYISGFTPGDTKDFNFKTYYKTFYQTGYVETVAFQAPTELVMWKRVVAQLDTKTVDDYVRASYLSKTEYALSTNGTDWDAWVEVTHNGGWITGTKRYIKFKFTFERPSGVDVDITDSFTLTSVKAYYAINATSKSLMAAEEWENRVYLCLPTMTDDAGDRP